MEQARPLPVSRAPDAAPQQPSRRRLVLLNVIGGALVLSSYVPVFTGSPEQVAALWGGVPVALKPLYTINMLLAAAGYLLFTHFVVFRLDPEATRIGARFDYGLFQVLYALVLVPSALWLPLTSLLIAEPSTALWWGIRFDLALVGLGAAGLLVALLRVEPVPSTAARRLAVIASVPFVVQTALLDALVWTAYFPR